MYYKTKEMKKNILIVGCGKMGLSHFKSFADKKNLNIYLYDKKIKNLNFLSSQRIFVLKNLNSIPKISLCILSTDCIPRFKILKKLLKKKKIKTFLIEKFIFEKESQFNFFSKHFETKNIYVNVWGKFIYHNIKKWLKKSSNYQIKIYIQKGIMLTNLIHFLNFISYIVKFKNYSKKNLKLINSNFKKYKELTGSISLIGGQNTVLIKTKNLKNIFEIDILEINKKLSIKIILDKDLNLNYFKNNILRMKHRFPLASFHSYEIFKKPLLAPKYDNLEEISINLLKFLKKTFNREVSIR